jgi:hypothetical protein
MSHHIIKSFAEGMFSAFSFTKNDPLVDMFRIEYAREYRNAVRNGIKVDKNFVRNYMANRNKKVTCNCDL